VWHHSIAASRDTVLIALHPMQRKTRSAALIEIAGSLPMQFIGKPHPPQLGGGAVGGGWAVLVIVADDVYVATGSKL
jgi:hypothetical protein